MSRIFINLRSQTAGLTGVQRYAQELCRRLNGLIEPVVPNRPLKGISGHLWEQLVLPGRIGNHQLWSPANTGPIAVTRQVVTVHDVAAVDHPEWFEPRFARWYRWMTPKLVKRARRVITVSNFSKRRLVALTGVEESRIVVIPNGVDSRFYPRNGSEINQISQRLRIPSSLYFLTVGSLEPRKNLATLFTAWRRALSTLPKDFWLVVAGIAGRPHVFRGTGIAEIPERVMFTGFVEDADLPALYSGATALLYPSVYEGFGFPVLEAMAAGCVPIAADSSALPEVVGDAGILVDVSDPEQLAEAIIQVTQDSQLRGSLRGRAMERSAEFTWERSAVWTKEVLAELCA